MNVLVHDAVRTPRGRMRKGSLADVRPATLAATTLRGLLDRTGTDPAAIDEVTLGVSSATGDQGADIGRAAVLWAGLDDRTAGGTVSRLCCSGIDAIATAAAKVHAGMHHVAVGGGVESMSRVGMFSDHGALHADPEVRAASGYVDIGPAADAMAAAAGFTREQLDALGVESNLRAAAATDRPSMLPVVDADGEVLLDHDEGIRPDATLEAFAQLPALFGEVDDAQRDVMCERLGLDELQALHTIATSPKMCDGASAVLLAAPGQLDSPPRARIVAAANVALRSPGLTGGTVAVQQAVEQAGMRLDDVDLFEINESFAATPLHFMTTTGVDADRVNVTGGAMAMGHPLGATGGILLATLLDELEARDLQVGALAIPAAGGLGSALVVERV